MGILGFLMRKDGVCIEPTTLVKRLSDGAQDYAGISLDSQGCPTDVYLYGEGHDTLASHAQMTRRLKSCVYTIRQLRSDVRKHGTVAFYLTPHQFNLSFRTKDDKLLSCLAQFRLGPHYIDHGQSAEFGSWLNRRITKSSENIDAAALAELLNDEYPSDRLPDWLEFVGEPKIEEIAVEPEIEEESAPNPETPGVSIESLAIGSLVFGRYRIERELGKGGMGQVLLAVDTQTTIEARRHVVLKVLHLENAHDPKSQEEFKKEAETLASLHNDRIAACFNSRMLGDVPILIMEYVEGVSLDEFLAEREGILDEKTTRELLLPIAEALDYAHQKKIYHLDVKPQNIIVRKTPQLGIKTCLLDFGIACKAQPGDSVTRVLATAGTPQYMSQEQRNNEPASVAMDVFALAVTAYECLAGEMPYPQGQTINHTVKPLASDSAFARAIMRGLNINPGHRPETCVELINPSTPTPSIATVTPPKPTSDCTTPPKESEDLRKSFENYRMMLAQSATRWARTNENRAQWMRHAQAALRDLTKDPQRADATALVGFFKDVARRIAEENTSADDFFVETVRLVELRNGLPKSGGDVWRALKESID